MLEGIALGAQTSMKDTQDIMVAIAAHKGLAAYALGASLVESKVCDTADMQAATVVTVWQLSQHCLLD